MECKRCSGAMMQETVIKLRRGFLGFRETRFAGAYCMTCRIGVAVDGAAPAKRQRPLTIPSRGITRPRLPLWCLPAVTSPRSDGSIPV
jgi:hypothetical protein